MINENNIMCELIGSWVKKLINAEIYEPQASIGQKTGDLGKWKHGCTRWKGADKTGCSHWLPY